MGLGKALIGAALALAAGSWPAAAFDGPPANGSTTYEVTPDPEDTAGAILTASGRIENEFAFECGEFRSRIDSDVHGVTAERLRVFAVIQATLSEKKDRARFNVISRPKDLEVHGEATRDGNVISVSFDGGSPAALRFEDSDVLFPTELTEKAIEAAKAGETFITARVFDPSFQRPTLATVFIGDPAKVKPSADQERFAAALHLEGVRWWPMTISTFGPDQERGEVPLVASEELVYANGASITRRLLVAGAPMKVNLVEAKPVATKPCS